MKPINWSFIYVLCLWICVVKSAKNTAPINASKSGKPSTKITTRIVGGYETTISKIGGYLVALFDRKDFFCGGSYVHPKFVVTAAHCLYERMNNVDKIFLQADISSLDEINERVGVERAYMHEKYNDETVDFDVAVLQLKKPLKGKHVRTIKLCTRDLKPGDRMTASGWGFKTNEQSFISTQEKVHSVQVPYIDHNKCKDAYKTNNTISITANMICAGVLGEKDACVYDSGGPLTFRGELCGVVSFGVTCADSFFPGVYTNVKKMVGWINDKIQHS